MALDCIGMRLRVVVFGVALLLSATVRGGDDKPGAIAGRVVDTGSGSPVAPGWVTSKLARASPSRFWVCMAIELMSNSGRPWASSAYGMIDANGCPGCRRDSVASAPVRPWCTSVRARSANVGSGTEGASDARGGPACWLMPSSYRQSPVAWMALRIGRET